MAGSGSARRRRLCSPPPLPRAGAAERRHWPLPPCLSRGQAAADPLSRGSPAPDPHLVVENRRRFLPRATAAPPSLRRRPLPHSAMESEGRLAAVEKEGRLAAMEREGRRDRGGRQRDRALPRTCLPSPSPPRAAA
uniref:Uncharacterized protein n=1 Tax=Oryza nivara TaxID=4536 RepID=A0A0E0FWJ1_ORYNI